VPNCFAAIIQAKNALEGQPWSKIAAYWRVVVMAAMIATIFTISFRVGSSSSAMIEKNH